MFSLWTVYINILLMLFHVYVSVHVIVWSCDLMLHVFPPYLYGTVSLSFPCVSPPAWLLATMRVGNVQPSGYVSHLSDDQDESRRPFVAADGNDSDSSQETLHYGKPEVNGINKYGTDDWQNVWWSQNRILYYLCIYFERAKQILCFVVINIEDPVVIDIFLEYCKFFISQV